MNWLFFIPALGGIWRFRYWAFWKPVLWVFAVIQITALLISASGEYPDIRGDGLITGLIRWHTNDGPQVLFALLGFILALVACGWLLNRARLAMRPPNPGADSARRVPLTQKAVETFGLLLGVLAMSFLIGSINNLWIYVIAPEMFARQPAAQAAGPNQPTLEELVESTATALSRTLPQQVDPSTRLVGVDADGRTLVYQYELTEEVSASRLRAFFSSNNLPKLCADPDMSASMRDGVSFAYAYTMKSGRKQTIIVDEEACASGQPRAGASQ